jgi:hypothetical protein
LAIDTKDPDLVKALMTRNPQLHRAPLGYQKNGPLTLGRRVPGTVGAAGCCAANNGPVDDRPRIGCAARAATGL